MRGSSVRVVRIALPLLMIVAGVCTACGEPVATQEPVFLKVAGSTAMTQLANDVAAGFTEQSPLVIIDVTGQGTRYGLNELAAGRVDLALASWLPSDPDTQRRATAIARDGIAIIVHPSNDVDGVGLLQLQDLFAGHIYEWVAIGGTRSQGEVQVVSREADSGTRDAFEALVMDEQRVTPLAVVAPSGESVVEYVVTHPGSVGYVSMGSVNSKVKVLSVEGEMPTVQSAQRGSYPLSRELWFVTAEAPARPVQAFLRFAQSPAGQQIVGKSFGRVR